MATLKEAIYKLLQDDAKLHNGTELGSLLGKYATAPYGIYFTTPPVEPAPPVVTYFINAQAIRSQELSLRDIFINITAWGANFEAVITRIYDLLNGARLTTTDFLTLMLYWDGAGPELFDEDLHCYYRQDRFFAKAIKV